MDTLYGCNHCKNRDPVFHHEINTYCSAYFPCYYTFFNMKTRNTAFQTKTTEETWCIRCTKRVNSAFSFYRPQEWLGKSSCDHRHSWKASHLLLCSVQNSCDRLWLAMLPYGDCLAHFEGFSEHYPARMHSHFGLSFIWMSLIFRALLPCGLSAVLPMTPFTVGSFLGNKKLFPSQKVWGDLFICSL